MSTTEPYFGEPLTPAEHKVLDLVCEGLENPEIARRRFASVATIKRQLQSILVKLGARNRTHAAVIHLKEGEEDGSPRDERKARER